jgi:integrase
MARIEERVGRSGKISWRVRVRLKGRRGQTATFPRKTDALRWAQRVESDLRAGRHFPSNEARRRTVSELLDRYRAEVLPQYSRREQGQRLGKLGWWEAQLGARCLADLSAASISECRARLARGEGLSGQPVSAATQTRYLATIKHVLSIARREWEWLDENPAERVRAPREPRGRVRYLSEEERDRLLRACRASQNPTLYALAVIAVSTGARLGELLQLQWRDVDLQRGLATVHHTKNGERRSLSLRGIASEVLQELARVRRIDNDSVFCGRRGKVDFPRRAWLAALAEAKLEDFRFHDLRHTCASYLAMSGATLAEIAEVLGHKTLAMVKRYAHLTEQHTSSVVERMNAKFLAATNTTGSAAAATPTSS